MFYDLHDDMTINVCRLWPMLGARSSRSDMAPLRLLTKVLVGKTIEVYGEHDGLQARRDWLAVQCAVDGLIKALSKPLGYEVFHFGSGKSTTLGELISLAEDVVGKRAQLKYVPRPEGDTAYVGVAATEKSRRLLGWVPKTDIRVAFRQMLHHITLGASSRSEVDAFDLDGCTLVPTAGVYCSEPNT